MAEEDIRLALAPYPDLPVDTLFDPIGPDYRLSVIEGDVQDTLPDWHGKADAWFLDGFAPAKNPRMWDARVMSEVAAHTVRGGTFATYTAVGDVRRALSAAGFKVERVPGFGRKRHMTRGQLP